MHRMWCLFKAGTIFLLLVLFLTIVGCAVSGTVVDRSEFKTYLKKMRLEEYPALKVYHGGAVREIPLQDVIYIKIDPSETVLVENELFYGARIILRGGEKIKSPAKVESYMSIQNTLSGKNGKEKFRISLDNAALIEIE